MFRRETTASNAHALPVPPSSLRTLVVDDSASLLEAVCDVLEIEQLVRIVGRARDGVEAIQLASILHPDLMLMDVTMPNMNGLEATAMVKKILPSTRVILMSGEETLEMHRLAHAAGADGFLFKTSFPEEFVCLLDRICPDHSCIT